MVPLVTINTNQSIFPHCLSDDLRPVSPCMEGVFWKSSKFSFAICYRNSFKKVKSKNAYSSVSKFCCGLLACSSLKTSASRFILTLSSFMEHFLFFILRVSVQNLSRYELCQQSSSVTGEFCSRGLGCMGKDNLDQQCSETDFTVFRCIFAVAI